MKILFREIHEKKLSSTHKCINFDVVDCTQAMMDVIKFKERTIFVSLSFPSSSSFTTPLEMGFA
jgi:hypothetical protein